MKSLPPEITRALALRRVGKSLAEVAFLVGRAESTVQNWIAQHGGEVRETKAHREVIAIWQSGCTSVACIARQLGRSKNTVRRHLKRVGWEPSKVTNNARLKYEDDEPTEAELNALIAERMKCLPKWFRSESEPAVPAPTMRLGRAAEMIPTKSYRILRKLGR